MHTEQEWLDRADAEDEHGAAERYQYFMRPEPKEDLGPIYEVNDPYLGPNTKVREMTIGMVRNAKPENKKSILAFLQPFPHTRIDTAKPLQGWYQSMVNESKQSRPRPCFTEAVLTEPYGGFCAVGCVFSLPAGEMVDTQDGSKPIERFKIGDWVYGRTVLDHRLVRVTGISKHWKPEGLVEVELTDGRVLRMTGDHPVYSRSHGWVAAESLIFREELEDVSMSRLSRSVPWEGGKETVSSLLAPVQSSVEKTRSSLSRLWGAASSEPSDRLRCLQLEDQSWQRSVEKRSAQHSGWKAQIHRDSQADVRPCTSESSEHVSTSARTEICRVQIGAGGGCTQRGGWLSSLEAPGIHGQEGQDVSDAINLGSLDSRVFGQAWLRLGLRAILDSVARRLDLSPRLQAESPRPSYRGQRVHDKGWSEEDYSGPLSRLLHRGLRPEVNGAARHPVVKKVTRIQGAVWVYDIETESGNFYQQGVLVHNCYINSGMRGYRGSGLITVPLNYGGQIRDQLTKMRRAAAGYFSSFTDPFTPLEQYYHNTQLAAEEFVRVGLPIFFLSRLRYPEWAVDLLTQNPHSYAQKSINTCDPRDWQLLSPGALPLLDHLNDIRRLKRRGIYVSIQVNPITPGVTSNEQIIKLFRMLKNAGADHVIVKFVEAAYSWAPAMVEKMIKRFGDRGRKFEELFTQNIGSERTVEEKYRLEAHDLFSAYAKRIGLTYATCYEYRYDRDAAGNVLSKVGKSIGRDYTTAAQCHGHQVPVYARASEDEPFKPLEECPPSGCLYCAAENVEEPGKPRCGDELAGGAYALKLADLKTLMGQGQHRRYSLPIVS